MNNLTFDFQKYASNIESINKAEQSNAWICWWDGDDNLPLVVQICIDSVRNNSGIDNITLLTKYNYQEYVKLPPKIIKKFEDGLISIQTFTDILRSFILKQNGGLWLDSTILITSQLQEEFKQPLISVKHGNTTDFVSNGKWTAYFIGGEKNHPLFSFLCDVFVQYYEKYDQLVDYFLIDYLIAIAYTNIPSVKRDLDSIPINNTQVIQLQRSFNKPYNKQVFETLLGSTKVHKLNWRDKQTKLVSSDYSNFDHLNKMFAHASKDDKF